MMKYFSLFLVSVMLFSCTAGQKEQVKPSVSQEQKFNESLLRIKAVSESTQDLFEDTKVNKSK